MEHNVNANSAALRAEINQVKTEIARAVRKKTSDSKLVVLYEQLEALQDSLNMENIYV